MRGMTGGAFAIRDRSVLEGSFREVLLNIFVTLETKFPICLHQKLFEVGLVGTVA